MTKKTPKRSRRKKQIYSGVLSEPGPDRFRWPINESLSKKNIFGERSTKQVKDSLEAEIAPDAKNLLLLMDHYGIDRDHDDCWRILAFALARDHVPAFRSPPARGRPKQTIDKVRLYIEVQNLMHKKGHSVSSAVAIIKRKKYPNKTRKTIEGWYYEGAPEAEAMLGETEE